MKKIIISFLLIMQVTLSFSQFPEAPLPELFPVSPEAASMGRYGNLQTSLHTGNMNFSIPIHNLQVAGYSWPVSLNYSFGGLVLESKPSINGLGWNMSGMGAVTREVRGLPDEHTNGYYGSSDIGARIRDYVDNGNSFNWVELQNFFKGRWDKEADIYHVNAGSVRFSFKIGVDGNPLYQSQHNHIVHYLDEQITVTDDNGIVYVFSDRETNEPSDASASTLFTYTTSWYLSHINYPNGQYINFHYQDDQYISYNFWASGGGVTGSYDTFLPGIGHDNTELLGFYKDGINQTIMNRKLLKNITTSGYGSVNFTIGDRGDYNERKVYTGVTVSKDGTEDQFSFSYDGVRDLMTEVTKNDQLLYGFEYYEGIMPSFLNSLDRKPTAQDRWGFYNGANSNLYALNIPTSIYETNNIPNMGAARTGAMRKIIYPTKGFSIVNYESHQAKDDYTLEALTESSLTYNREILLKLQSDNNTLAPAEKTVEFTYTFKQAVVADISHLVKGTRQNSNLQMSFSRADACPAEVGQPERPLFSDDYHIEAQAVRDTYKEYVPKMCPSLGIQFGPDEGDPGYYEFSGNSGGRIVIKPGTYNFKITNYYNRTSDAYAQIRVLFHEPISGTDDPKEFVNTIVGGIRVHSIEHFSDPKDNTLATTQYFNYEDENKLSTGVLINRIQPVSTRKRAFFVGVSYDYTVDNYLKGFNSMDTDPNAPVYYTAIKEYSAFEEAPNIVSNPVGTPIPNDTNPDESRIMSSYGSPGPLNKRLVFPNGHKETTFEFPNQNYDYVHPGIPKHQDLNKGRISSVTIYKNENNRAVPIQKSMNQYITFRKSVDTQTDQDSDSNHPWGIRVAEKLFIEADCTNLANCSENPTPEYEQVHIDRYHIAPYREVHSNYKKQLITETTFYDENGNPKEVTTSTQNTYNSHYNVSETEVNFGEEGIVKSVYHYPYDALSNFENLSSTATTALNELKGQNRVAAPIQTKVYQKEGTTETLVSTQRTDFKKWTIGTPARTLILPEKMMIAKASNTPEERMIYHDYDTRGNPLEVSQTNGVHIYYIWGYHHTYPIAKISNFTAAEAASIQTLIDNAITASNTDNGTDSNNIANETALRDALEAIRTDDALQNAQMTYSTYDPMVGVTSMTDARGYTMTYHYDNLRRLIAIKNEAGELVSENQYHYKN